MVENSNYLNCLRNGHIEKSSVTGIFRPSRSPKTAKTPRKVHLRLRFQNLGKPRTAGLCGRAAGACDCGPLSVLKSNGYNHPEIRLKKFDFSPKTTSANIVKKLSAHSLLKSVLFRIFSFSHKCLTFAFFGAAATAGLCKLAAVLSTLCSLPALRGTLLALVKAHAALTSPHIVQAIRISCLCVWIPSPAKGRKALFGGGQSAA